MKKAGSAYSNMPMYGVVGRQKSSGSSPQELVVRTPGESRTTMTDRSQPPNQLVPGHHQGSSTVDPVDLLAALSSRSLADTP